MTNESTMQALMMTKIKELQLVKVPRPIIDQPGDVLLKVKSAGICGSDLHGYTGVTGRRIPPLIMGHEASAEVVAVGEAVTNLTAGMRVAIHPLVYPLSNDQSKRRLMGMDAPGAFADYVVWPAANLYPLPENVSYEAGALAEPVAVAVRAVSKVKIQPDNTAFIVGAGPIGLLTLAVLRAAGLEKIAVSDTSAERLALARSLGAKLLINPLKQNPREGVNSFTGNNGVDIAFEAVGVTATVQQTLDAIRDGGSVVWIGNNQRIIETDMQAIVTRELKIFGTYAMDENDFQRAIHLLAAGQVPVDKIINRRADLREGPTLFDDLLTSPNIVKCVFNFP